MGIQEFLKKSEAEGKEKHVPDFIIDTCGHSGQHMVTIAVGKEILHPSTAEHSIKTITLYGVTDDDKLKELTVFQLGDENTPPVVRTTVKKEGFKQLIATSYCNLHGLWQSQIDL